MIDRRSTALAAVSLALALVLGAAAYIVRFDIAAVTTGGVLVLDRWAGSVSHCTTFGPWQGGANGSLCRQVYPTHRVEVR